MAALSRLGKTTAAYGVAKKAGESVARRTRRRRQRSRAQRLAGRASSAAGSIRSAGEGIAGAGRTLTRFGATVRDRAGDAQQSAEHARDRLARGAGHGPDPKKAAAAAGAVGAVGAAGAYLLDSEQGARRRSNLRQRMTAMAGRIAGAVRGGADGGARAGGPDSPDRTNSSATQSDQGEPIRL